jgi:predicted transglutaminase-like cysteine proteinase
MRSLKVKRTVMSGMAAVLLTSLVPSTATAGDTGPASDDEVIVTAPTRPNLFGTVAIPGPQGRWADKWHKVMSDTRSNGALAALIAPARDLDRLEQLRYLQAQVDRRVGWRSDTTQYGARTYWASAAETLSSGVGDDDDRAILKFQALRELGYPRNDFYLMMGRDRVRGDYVMLVAKARGRWWLLEEQGDTPVPAEQRTGFEPAASFGAGRAWVHGRLRNYSIAGGARVHTAAAVATATP